MDRSPSARALPWALFCVGYLAAWFVSTAVPTPLWWHLPLERRFVFAVKPLQLAADFYGRLLLAAVCGALAAGAGALALRLGLRTRTAWLVPLSAWIFGLLAFTAGLYLYILSSRQPIPAPLPPGYVAR